MDAFVSEAIPLGEFSHEQVVVTMLLSQESTLPLSVRDPCSEKTPPISHRIHLSEVFRRPLRDPLRLPFSSQSCRPCSP